MYQCVNISMIIRHIKNIANCFAPIATGVYQIIITFIIIVSLLQYPLLVLKVCVKLKWNEWQVKVTGPLTTGKALIIGAPSRFEVNSRDAGRAILETSIRDSAGNPVEIFALENKNDISSWDYAFLMFMNEIFKKQKMSNKPKKLWNKLEIRH